MIGPCMCGDPECGRCFPGTYRMARLYNSSEFQRRVDREMARIKADSRESIEALTDYPPDDDALTVLLAREHAAGTLPSSIDQLVETAIRNAAELRVEEDMS